MSMRMAASCCHPLHVMRLPRGARMDAGAWISVSTGMSRCYCFAEARTTCCGGCRRAAEPGVKKIYWWASNDILWMSFISGNLRTSGGPPRPLEKPRLTRGLQSVSAKSCPQGFRGQDLDNKSLAPLFGRVEYTASAVEDDLLSCCERQSQMSHRAGKVLCGWLKLNGPRQQPKGSLCMRS
jgi:hypothetical protein